MKISGFTIIRNAIIYDFPIVECIKSILDIVDEFIVVAGDSSDATDELLATIDSPKVRIIHTKWDLETFRSDGTIYAHQTDLALRECKGDWCFYLQSDEVLHHDALPVVKEACERYLNDQRVEGFVLKYIHIYANYKHYIDNLHFAYPLEVRIVRNRPDVHSWRDAQSFRIYEDFGDMNYLRKEGTRKLSCVKLDATIFHYGWSRNPFCMVNKVEAQLKTHYPDQVPAPKRPYFDYGNLSMIPLFKGTHPKVMEERIASFNWGDYIRYDGERPNIGKRYGLKYSLIRFIENKILGDGRRIGGFKNYKLIKP